MDRTISDLDLKFGDFTDLHKLLFHKLLKISIERSSLYSEEYQKSKKSYTVQIDRHLINLIFKD